MEQFANDRELFDYLVELSAMLERKGLNDLAGEVRRASLFASGSASEFYHESQMALVEVLRRCGPLLSAMERSDMESVVAQIQRAFERIGGA